MSFIFRPGGTNRPVLKQIPYYTAFNPRTVGTCALWLDAADPNGTGVRPSDGTTITTWIDKSGTSNHCTSGTATFQTDSYGGYINFTGSQSYTITSVNGVVNQYFTIFVAEQLQNYAGGESAFMGGTTGSANQNLHMRYVNGGGGMKFGFFFNDLDASLVAFTSNATQPIRVWSFSFTASSRIIYLNGTSVASDVNNSYISGWAGAQIGKMYGGQFYNGKMREVMIFSGTVSTTQRQQIESYLIQKWAPTVSLPQGHLHTTKPAGIPVVSVVRTDGFKLIALILSSGFMSTYYSLSTYSLGNIIASVPAGAGTGPTFIWTVAVPTGAKGKNGILAIFFNLYSASPYATGQYFDYGIYVDGTIQMLGDSTGTLRYVNAGATNFMMSSAGVSLGTNGLLNGFPLILPISLSANASLIQIGLKNSSLTMTGTASIVPGYGTNITTTTLGAGSNTSTYIPQNTFTTTGTTSYIVPSTTSAGTVNGVFIYCWGAGGQSYTGTTGSYGGTGAFMSGYYACASGVTLSIVVGAIGGASSASGGGGNQFSSNPQGGGFSGVFLGSVSQANAVAIAAGGGGSTSGLASGGGGGYPTGQYGYDIAGASNVTLPSPGTQSAGGSPRTGGATDGTAGQALIGGFGGYQPGGGRGGGGGGGYWGGGGGCTTTSPGAGGSSFYSGGLTSVVNSNGATTTSSASQPVSILPGGNTSPYYVTGYGHANSGTGLVVVVPAVGTSATQIGVSAALYSG